jgi:integrase
MAISIDDYSTKVLKLGKVPVSGLYSHNELNKFFYRFKKNGKSYKRIIDFSNKSWDKATINRKLLEEMELLRNDPNYNKIEETKVIVSLYKSTYTLNKVMDNYFKSKETPESTKEKPIYDTTWTHTKKRHYDNYIREQLGFYKLPDITPSIINQCIDLQAKKGLKNRTIITTLEILRPILDGAVDEGVIQSNPCNTTTVKKNENIKREKTKKKVDDPLQTMKIFYTAIQLTYPNDPKYKSLYLFGLQQRRKSEILKLRWEDVDFDNDTYLCRDVKNGEDQTFYLPAYIKHELLQFRKISGWIFESPILKNQAISNIEKQTTKIKNKVVELYSKILIDNGVTNKNHIKVELAKKPKFTLHYFRNVGSSLLHQKGLESFVSGAMGHSSLQTKDAYVTIDYLGSSKQYSNIVEQNLLLDCKDENVSSVKSVEVLDTIVNTKED